MRLFCIITRFWCGRKERKRRNSEKRASRNLPFPQAEPRQGVEIRDVFSEKMNLRKPYFSREPAYNYTVRATIYHITKIGCPMDILFLWCGRQELKTYDDVKKALKIKAFLLLNATVDAKIFTS